MQHKHGLDLVLLKYLQIALDVRNQREWLSTDRCDQWLCACRRRKHLPQVVRQVNTKPRVLEQA